MSRPWRTATEPVITAVTLAELSVGPLVAEVHHERAARQERLQEVESVFEPIPFDSAAARAFGCVAAAPPRSGRKPSARAFDALIAATAITKRVPLYTCDTRDHTGIDDLDVVESLYPDV